VREAAAVWLDGRPYRIALRSCSAADAVHLAAAWGPVLERGPDAWLDRDWPWLALDREQLAFDRDAQWIVAVDEIEPDGERDYVGVLVTTGPISGREAGLRGREGEQMMWVEYIAICPGLRASCPMPDRRAKRLRAVGSALVRWAIRRSVERGCEGRLGLHAEGQVAIETYLSWGMDRVADGAHPGGGTYPRFVGSPTWAAEFAKLPEGPR
jgi:hypothetical protein